MLIKQSCSYQLSRWPNPSHLLKQGLSHQHSNEIIYDRRLRSKPWTYSATFTFLTRWERVGMKGVYDERERQPERADGVRGWRGMSLRDMWEGIYSVFIDTWTAEKKNAQKKRGRKGGRETTKMLGYTLLARRAQGREEGQTNKWCSEWKSVTGGLF